MLPSGQEAATLELRLFESNRVRVEQLETTRVHRTRANSNIATSTASFKHGMRHTHASILIQRDVKPTVVADRLGHKDIAFTLKTYAHLFDEQRREAAMPMADFLGT